MFIKSLIPRVSARTRAKGGDYFRSGGVVDIGGGEWTAHAIVRGTRDYRVDLLRESGTDRFTASCECPYYADRSEICKHIWAALLEADRRGLLGGDGTILPDATLEPEYRVPPDQLHAPTTTPGSGGRGAKPIWERFLTELQQDAAAEARARPAPRFSNGEIVYSIDVRDTLNGFGTVLHVLFRQRRKGGAVEQGESGQPDAGRSGTPRRPDRPRNPVAPSRRGQSLVVRDDLRTRLLAVALRAQRTAGGCHSSARRPLRARRARSHRRPDRLLSVCLGRGAAMAF